VAVAVVVAVAATGAFPGFPKKGKVDEVVVPQRVSQGDGCGDGKKETQTLATISSHPLGCGLLALGCWLLAGGSWVFCLWFLAATCGLWLPHPHPQSAAQVARRKLAFEQVNTEGATLSAPFGCYFFPSAARFLWW